MTSKSQFSGNNPEMNSTENKSVALVPSQSSLAEKFQQVHSQQARNILAKQREDEIQEMEMQNNQERQNMIKQLSDEESNLKQKYAISNSRHHQNPETLFQLIQKSGSQGRYQTLIFIIFVLQWFLSGILVLGISFMYMNRTFNCPKNGLLVQGCHQTVCEMKTLEEREKYLADKLFESLATEYGPFYCQDQSLLAFFKISVYIGAFVGYALFSLITDNYGRRFSMLISWGCTCFGLLLLSFAFNIWMGFIGIFIAASGAKGSLRVTGLVLAQVVSPLNGLRQKYLAATQIFYGMSSIFVGISFYLVGNWRIIAIVFMGVPAFVMWGVLYFYMMETPRFLLKRHSQESALKAFQKIGRINKISQKDMVTISDIERVRHFQNQKTSQNKYTLKIYNQLDLCKYKSLRGLTFCLTLIAILLNFLFLAPILIINEFDVNIFIVQIVFGIADSLAYYGTTLKVKTLPRVKTPIIALSISAFCTGLLIFVQKPVDCHNCKEAIIQLIFVFISRFCVTFYLGLFTVHCVELYPQCIRAVGISTTSAISILTPVVIPYLLAIKGLNSMLVFTIASLGIVFAVQFLEETLNKPLKQEIEELLTGKRESLLTDSTGEAASQFRDSGISQ